MKIYSEQINTEKKLTYNLAFQSRLWSAFANTEMLADGKSTIKNNFIIVLALMELAGFENIGIF